MEELWNQETTSVSSRMKEKIVRTALWDIMVLRAILYVKPKALAVGGDDARKLDFVSAMHNSLALIVRNVQMGSAGAIAKMFAIVEMYQQMEK